MISLVAGENKTEAIESTIEEIKQNNFKVKEYMITSTKRINVKLTKKERSKLFFIKDTILYYTKSNK